MERAGISPEKVDKARQTLREKGVLDARTLTPDELCAALSPSLSYYGYKPLAEKLRSLLTCLRIIFKKCPSKTS